MSLRGNVLPAHQKDTDRAQDPGPDQAAGFRPGCGTFLPGPGIRRILSVLPAVPDLISRTEPPVQELGKDLLFFRKSDHHLGSFRGQDIISRRVPEYVEAEIVPGPALLDTAAGQQDLGVLAHHLPSFDPDHRAGTAALKLVPEEIPPRTGPWGILLGQVHEHPGDPPVPVLPVYSVQETDDPGAELYIVHMAAGKQILPVTIGSLFFSCKTGGKILRVILARISGGDPGEHPGCFCILLSQDQQVDDEKTRHQILVAADRDLLDQLFRLQKPVFRVLPPVPGILLFKAVIRIQAHQLQLEKPELSLLTTSHGGDI